jgi:hypothetical protein
MWHEYQLAYHYGQIHDEYKSSPLADDHEFCWDTQREHYDLAVHQTQVLDLSPSLEELWRGVRKSYQSLINRGLRSYDVEINDDIEAYVLLHAQANGGSPRSSETYACQGRWLTTRNGLLIMADRLDHTEYVAAVYWIIYQGGAYYASGPSLEKNIQHAVIWKSLELLKAMGVRLIELGQIDGETDKEKSIGHFKAGFGGQSAPYTVATRRTI